MEEPDTGRSGRNNEPRGDVQPPEGATAEDGWRRKDEPRRGQWPPRPPQQRVPRRSRLGHLFWGERMPWERDHEPLPMPPRPDNRRALLFFGGVMLLMVLALVVLRMTG